jgi:hypothetical protein
MDIFISYNWKIKEQVKLLHEILEKENFKVWRDDRQLHAGNSALTVELAKSNLSYYICASVKWSELQFRKRSELELESRHFRQNNAELNFKANNCLLEVVLTRIQIKM